MTTREEAKELEQVLRREFERTPALSLVTVKQVTDNVVDSQDPHGWTVQLLDGRVHNLPAYVRSLEHWRIVIKPQLMRSAAEDERNVRE